MVVAVVVGFGCWAEQGHLTGTFVRRSIVVAVIVRSGLLVVGGNLRTLGGWWEGYWKKDGDGSGCSFGGLLKKVVHLGLLVLLGRL
jgi:hypothetical protein